MEVERVIFFGNRQELSIYVAHIEVFEVICKDFFRASITYPGMEIST